MMDTKTITDKNIKIILLIGFSLLLVLINIFRLHYNVFWLDECYSINSTDSLEKNLEFIKIDAANPPLYVFALYLFSSAFGRTPEVYQLFSFIPWMLILLISITTVRKKFGYPVAIITILLSSLLQSSLTYMVEVRSYEWGAFLVLLDFLLLHDILNSDRKHYYVLFVITSLAAAYLHYYCILAISFFYIALLFNAFKNKTELPITIAASVITIVGYIPWLIFAYDSIMYTTTIYFQANYIPTFFECISWMYNGAPNLIVFILIVCLSIIIYKEVKKDGSSNNKKLLWIIAGIGSVFGSVAVAILVSELLRPLIFLRYFYPVSSVSWLLLAYSISHCWNEKDTLKKPILAAFIVILLMIGVSNYQSVVTDEDRLNDDTEDTLGKLYFIGEGDYVMTNLYEFDWAIIHYYLPKARCSYVDLNNIPTIDDQTNTYLFIKQEIDENTINQLNDQGYTYELINSKACLGTCYHYEYRIVAI